ncbi:MAG: CehA/McbA family metallohydrolase [Polyangiaceae bacterium]
MSASRAAMLFRLGCLLAFGCALLIGHFTDPAPARPVATRRGYTVLQADMHAHTRFSDGVLSPLDLVLAARRNGLDVIAITEHNQVFPGKLGRALATMIPDAPVVVVGEEITMREAHLLAYGLERTVEPADVNAVARAVHAQGGVLVAAHPTRRYWPAIDAVCPELDGIEVVHPIAFRQSSPIGSYSEIEELASERCARPGLAMLGNSDYHAGSELGRLRTYLFVTSRDERGVVDAIREGRTVTVAPSGRVWGPPDLVAALEAEPLPARDTRGVVRARGAIDVIGRVLGLLALVGLVGVSARRAPRSGASIGQ